RDAVAAEPARPQGRRGVGDAAGAGGGGVGRGGCAGAPRPVVARDADRPWRAERAGEDGRTLAATVSGSTTPPARALGPNNWRERAHAHDIAAINPRTTATAS